MHRNVKGHTVFNAVITSNDVLENLVDRFGLRFRQETDTAQVHPEHGDRRVSGELGAPQECAVSAEDEHELTPFGRVGIGFDDLDIRAEPPHLGRIKIRLTTVDGLGRQHAQRNPVVAQHFLHAPCRLRGLVAACVHHQQHRALLAHCGPSATARATALSSASPLSGRSV